MNTWVLIGLIVIVLHLFIGFGWLLYKLMGPVKKEEKSVNDDQK